MNIPLDIAVKKLEYLRGIKSTQLIHRPSKEEFENEVSNIQTEVKTIQSKLRETKQDISKAKKILKATKRLRGEIDREIEVTKINIKTWKNMEKIELFWKQL